MRHSFAKLMALLLALLLVLSGCNLIDVDQVAVIEEQRAEVEKELSTVLVEYDGGTITEFDVMASFYGNYSYIAQLYSSFGMSMDSGTVNDILQDVVDTEIQSRAIAKEFESRGLTLSKTLDEIYAEADEAYQSNYDYVYENAEGDTDEVRAANTELSLYQQGYTKDHLREYFVSTYQTEAVGAGRRGREHLHRDAHQAGWHHDERGCAGLLDARGLSHGQARAGDPRGRGAAGGDRRAQSR